MILQVLQILEISLPLAPDMVFGQVILKSVS